MALEDIFKGIQGFEAFEGLALEGGVSGIALGIGTAILAPVVIPVLAGVGKPLTKAAIKEGLLIYEKSKEAFAEMTEVLEDLVAEAKAELAQEHQVTDSSAAGEHPEIVHID